MKALRHLFILTMLAWTAAACGSKDNDPAPTTPTGPAMELTMTRTQDYLGDRTDAGITYTHATMSGQGRLANQELSLYFAPKEGLDAISFVVAANKLATGMVGTYTLKSQPDPTLGVVVTRYTLYSKNTTGSSTGTIYDSSWSLMPGELKITSYDAQRGLISGSYTLQMDNIPDPFDGRLGSTEKEHCNLKVTGAFTNLKLQ